MNGLRQMITDLHKTFDQMIPQLEANIARLSGGLLARGHSGGSQPVDIIQFGFPPGFSPPSITEVQQRELPAPACSVLLGIGTDEGAYHLDLDNPVSGAVLVIGDEGADLLGLLRSMLASVTRFNLPQLAKVSVICKRADDFVDFADKLHVQDIMPTNDPLTSEFVREVAAEAVARSQGKKPDPAVVLFIDDLARCLTFLDQAAYERLYWLIRHGPRYRIWTIAAQPVERYFHIDPQYLSAFRTRLVGHIHDRNVAARAAHSARLRTERLGPNLFYTPYREESHVFCICPIEN